MLIGTLDPTRTDWITPVVRSSLEYTLANDSIVQRRIGYCTGEGTIERVTLHWMSEDEIEQNDEIVPWPTENIDIYRKPSRMQVQVHLKNGETVDTYPKIMVIGGPEANEKNALIAITRGHENDHERATRIVYDALRPRILEDAELVRRTMDNALHRRCALVIERARATDPEDADLKVIKHIAEEDITREVDSRFATFKIKVRCGKVTVSRTRTCRS